jgi:hypothetical protein
VPTAVIGNGESRKTIDLFKLKQTHVLVGCNAIHRDITANHLVCCDRKMVSEATSNPLTKDTLIYVRPNWHHYFRKIKKLKNIRLVPELPYKGNKQQDDPFHWGSGGFAVLLAATLSSKEIDLYGFDLYPLYNKVNNIYKNTENYADAGSQPVDPSYWIYQIGKVFDYFPNSKFKIHNVRDWPLPIEWQKNNVEFVDL